MNRLIRMLLIVLGCGLALTVATGADEPNAPVTTSADDTFPTPTGNPFQYRIPYGDGGFVLDSHEPIPAGIKVLAIIVVQGQEPLAVLRVPGMVDVFYIHPGDIIGVQSPITAARTGASRSQSPTASRSVQNQTQLMYLKIESITAQQVILYPQKNPAGKQILR